MYCTHAVFFQHHYTTLRQERKNSEYQDAWCSIFLLYSFRARRDDNGVQGVSSFDLSRYYHATFAMFVEILPNTEPEAETSTLSDWVISLPAARHVSLTVDKPATQVLDQILKLK